MVESTATRAGTPVKRSFPRHVLDEVRIGDGVLLLAIPFVLAAVSVLPVGTREELVFDISEPSILTAYTSHFVHTSPMHLAGNLAVYVVFAPLTYVICALSGQRDVFRYSVIVFLVVFPFALSGMQLSFQTDRVTLGFSGINAAFVGLLCFAVVRYAERVLFESITYRHAPALLFLMFGLITLVSLPARAWRIELAALSFAVAGLYAAGALYSTGRPSFDRIRGLFGKPGYIELAGAALATVLSYPVIGFQERVIPEGGVADVYIHLLGLALAFIVVYVFVFFTDER